MADCKQTFESDRSSELQGLFQPTRRAVLIGGAAAAMVNPAKAAGELTSHYELAFIDKDRRQLVALFQIPLLKDAAGGTGPLQGPASAATAEKEIAKAKAASIGKSEAEVGEAVKQAAKEFFDKRAKFDPDAPKFLMLWDRREFGPNAGFTIERKSKPYFPDGKPPEHCHDACNDQTKPSPAKTAIWLPTEWKLTVNRASFPGNEEREFVATFTFSRADEVSKWYVSATIRSWWSSPVREIKSKKPAVGLEEFLGNEHLAFEIDTGQNLLLKALFWERIEARGTFELQINRNLAWAIDTKRPRPLESARLYILDIPLEFGRLSLTRLRGDASPNNGAVEPDPAAGKERAATAGSQYLFEEQVVHGRPKSRVSGERDGLYGVVEEIAGFTKPKPRTAAKPKKHETPELQAVWAFEFARTKVQGSDLVASVELDNAAIDFVDLKDLTKVHVASAIRHWGFPKHTVAGCVAMPSNDARSIGRLKLQHGAGEATTTEGPFEFCGFELMRQQQRDGIITSFRARPTSKESIAGLRLGDIGLAALPAISAGPGVAPRVPSIDVMARDKEPAREDDVRQLVGFSARLALDSAAIALPERIVPASGDKPAEVVPGRHIARLQFHDADALIYVPALGPAPVTSADAIVPIGPVVAGVKVTFDLGRAQLSVIRPSDLLALKYRFSGLELVVPWPPAPNQAAQLAPHGGRSTGRPFAQAPRSEATPRDERPLLVVEFPPQHVVERAYFRQLPAPLDLPELTNPAPADEEATANIAYLKRMLLEPKHWSSMRFPTTEEDAAERFRIWLGKLLKRVYSQDKDNFGTTRNERVGWRRALQVAANWPNGTDLFPKDPGASGATRQTTKDFDDLFVGLCKAKDIPQEQQVYAGSDFLDPDARRIATEVLRTLNQQQAGAPPRPWPAARLTPREWEDLFTPLIKPDVLKDKKEIPPQDSGPHNKNLWPAFADVADWSDKKRPPEIFAEIERARERRDREYAAFRSLYREAAKSGSKLEILTKNPEYLGPTWFEGLIAQATAASVPDEQRNQFNDFRMALEKALTASDQEEFKSPVPARLSGPSRIAFRVDCDDYESDRAGGRIPYTLEGLTNWGGMDMAVVRRAERLMQPLQGTRLPPRWGRRALNDEAAILQFQGFTSSRRWGNKKEDYRRAPATAAMTAEQRLAEVYASSSRAPDAFETAIELPFRLFLSPAQDATWITTAPRVRRDAGFADDLSMFRELWTARLGGRDDGAGLRAIWSPDYRPEALLSIGGPGAPPMGPYAPWALPRAYGVRKVPDQQLKTFRTGLEPFDRHELVVLSSVHGLPVLGRRAPSGDLAPDADQIEPPDGFRLQGVLPEMIGGKPLDMTAIYRPRPLSVNELSLSALGGNLDIDAAFQPPASARRKSDAVNLFDAFSVERWRQRTVLGRDILVEVVYKGFLFPIGHRASLVKLTERRFEMVAGNDSPVAILVQRKFLKIGKPEKRFMAEGQPNRASRWPCERILMLTRQTPDLVDATSDDRTSLNELGVLPRGTIDLGEGTTGLCMWPRTSARRGAEVWFEMQIGDEPTPVRMPLIFVNNIAANDDKTVDKLVQYYNETNNFEPGEASPTRKLIRNGQPVVMAPEYKPGDTTFDTEWWLVGAEGREKEYPLRDQAKQSLTLNNTNYIRTSFMEGQDQPPFYPLIERAKCRLKSVERFTGSGPLWAQVAFDGVYVASGFTDVRDDETGKPRPRVEQSEIYLRVVESDEGGGTLPLDFKDRGDLAGGVAHPTMDVIAISRQLGPINGGQVAPALSRPMTAADTPMPADSPANPTTGILPVLERINRFKDSINIVPKGRFLGIMELSDLLEKVLGVNLHPKLNELIEYAAASAGGAASGTLTEVRSLLTKALIAPAEQAVAEVEKAWIKLANESLKAKGVKVPTLADIYPQIGTDIGGLHQLLLDAQRPATDDISFFAELAAIHEAARRLGRSIDNIARDPLAAAATAQLDIFRELARPVNEIRTKIDELKELNFATALYATIEPQAKILVLARLQKLASIDPDEIDTKQAVKDLNDVVRKALNAAWPPKEKSIQGLAGVPKAIAQELRKEVSAIPAGDLIRKAPAEALADKLDELSDEIQPAIAAAIQFRTDLTSKLDRADASLRATIIGLQKDAEEAQRRAQQAVLEILLAPQVATVLIVAIEIEAAFGKDPPAPPFDQEKLTKLLGAVAPALKALAILGGADTAAAKLFDTMNTLCGQVKTTLQAGIAAVLPPPGALSISAGKPAKVISDAADEVSALLSGDDKTTFDKAATDTLAKIRDLESAVTALTGTVTGWTADPTCKAPPPALAEQLRDVARKYRLLASALQRLVDTTAGLIRQKLTKDVAQGQAVLKAIDLVKRIFENAEKLTLLATAANSPLLFQSFANSLQTLSDAVRPSMPLLADALAKLAKDQTNRPDLSVDGLKDARDKFAALDETLRNQTTTTAKAIEDLEVAMDAAKQEFVIQQELVLRRIDQALTAELNDLIAPLAAVAQQWATDLLTGFGGLPLTALFNVLTAAVEGRKTLNKLMEERGDVVKHILDTLAKDIGAGMDRRYLFLVDPNADLAKPDALQQEQIFAQSAREKWPTDQVQALIALSQLADAWRRPALVVLVQRFNGLSTAFLRAVLVEALDLRALRRELDRIVRELIPSKAILGYTLSTPVRRFGLPGIGDIFLPVKDTKIDIRMQAVIDLQNPTAPDARVDGRMGPFGIQLFGSFDVVTLNFYGLEFRSGGGRSSGFDVRFGDFQIGSKAKFLKQLEPFVSPKSGLPPVRMMRDKPGIEATYGINLGSFGVGYLSFSNVSLNAGARLPFGAREEAEFLISIGRQDAPFLISSTVFGGGGYLALLANGKGFIGLETSFDYGGVFAFGFGPLTGAGQITLGMYFRAARGSPARLGMNFMARGAANIACFSICAALFVRLTYSGGKMDGQASYTFSFSIGIDDIDFTFDVYIDQGGSAGSGSPTSAFLDLPGMPSLTQFAGAESELFDVYALDGPVPKPSGCKLKGPELSVKTPSSKANWKSYHALFDSSLDPIVKV